MADGNLIDLGVGGGDEVQPIALVIPCYTHVPTRFLRTMLQLVADFPAPMRICVIYGVYPEQAMRHAVHELKDDPVWKRMVVLEQDMIIPRDGLIKHALHTDDIVGSIYFQHAPPYQINMMFEDPEKQRGFGHPQPAVIKSILEKPALYKCDIVGLGCTSIARRVFDEWPSDVPMFRTDYVHQARQEGVFGQISHDVWFCREAGKLGYSVYIDSSIKCDHLTEGFVNSAHYLRHAAEQTEAWMKRNNIALPQRGVHVPKHTKGARLARTASGGR